MVQKILLSLVVAVFLAFSISVIAQENDSDDQEDGAVINIKPQPANKPEAIKNSDHNDPQEEAHGEIPVEYVIYDEPVRLGESSSSVKLGEGDKVDLFGTSPFNLKSFPIYGPYDFASLPKEVREQILADLDGSSAALVRKNLKDMKSAPVGRIRGAMTLSETDPMYIDILKRSRGMKQGVNFQLRNQGSTVMGGGNSGKTLKFLYRAKFK